MEQFIMKPGCSSASGAPGGFPGAPGGFSGAPGGAPVQFVRDDHVMDNYAAYYCIATKGGQCSFVGDRCTNCEQTKADKEAARQNAAIGKKTHNMEQFIMKPGCSSASGAPGGFPGAPGGFPGAPGGFSGAPGGFPGAPGGFSGAPGGFPGAPGGAPVQFVRDDHVMDNYAAYYCIATKGGQCSFVGDRCTNCEQTKADKEAARQNAAIGKKTHNMEQFIMKPGCSSASGAPGGFPGAPGGFSGAPGGFPGAPGGFSGAPGGFSGAPGGFPGAPGGAPVQFVRDDHVMDNYAAYYCIATKGGQCSFVGDRCTNCEQTKADKEAARQNAAISKK